MSGVQLIEKKEGKMEHKTTWFGGGNSNRYSKFEQREEVVAEEGCCGKSSSLFEYNIKKIKNSHHHYEQLWNQT